jgi:organic radical activating enzyme
MKKYNIAEVFHSIQGEGANIGMPSIFIRFAGCNLNCSFCDTDHTKKYEWTVKDILERIIPYKCKNIILTGGEPTLQVDFYLLAELYNNGFDSYIETNGEKLISYPDTSYLSWITVSPKNFNFKQREGDELKLVYTGQNNQFLDSIIKSTYFDFYYLQPCYIKEGDNTKEVIEIIKKNNKWRLSLQCQKLIGIK